MRHLNLQLSHNPTNHWPPHDGTTTLYAAARNSTLIGEEHEIIFCGKTGYNTMQVLTLGETYPSDSTLRPLWVIG